MKKLLLATLISFSCTSIFAVECTKKEYEPYFSDTKRYIMLPKDTSSNSYKADEVVDKNSIKYDKQAQIIKVTTIRQLKYNPNAEAGIMKLNWEFDIERNQYRTKMIEYSCNGKVLDRTATRWYEIGIKEINGIIYNFLINYLNIEE